MNDEYLKRLIGNLFVVGFEGTCISTELRDLIEHHYVGAILLSSKNIKSAAQLLDLIAGLQRCARNAGYRRPLLIALDQENGGMNSLVDPLVTQFPSAMGIAAASATSGLARDIAQASASELACVGINWILGPVFDVLSQNRASPLGVRSFGDEPMKVTKHGVDFVKGYKAAGVLSCGKHFPSFGDVELRNGDELAMPSISEPIDDLNHKAFLPFRTGAWDGLDAFLVGGCSLEMSGRHIPYAFLDWKLVTGIIRQNWNFDGVILSDCLGMEALCDDVGVTQGTAMAAQAGCDMMLICHSYRAQVEGFHALKLAVDIGNIPLDQIIRSNERVDAMKDRYISWEQIENPPGLQQLRKLNLKHQKLSERAYEASISLVRDKAGVLDVIRSLSREKQVLLLTPLLSLFPSTATRDMSEEPRIPTKSDKLAPGEEIFQEFGQVLARELQVRLIHASYSSNGIKKKHEELVSSSSIVILVTADATRNSYQYGLTKHANMQCKFQPSVEGQQTRLIVIALSSPYDFLIDSSIDTYICTYDFTPIALRTLTRLLAGKFEPTGIPPVAEARKANELHNHSGDSGLRMTWLVELFDNGRDDIAINNFIRRNPEVVIPYSQRNPQTEKMFVVRNRSTAVIFGLVIASVATVNGEPDVKTLCVDVDRRNMGIEKSLRDHAMRHLSRIRAETGGTRE